MEVKDGASVEGPLTFDKLGPQNSDPCKTVAAAKPGGSWWVGGVRRFAFLACSIQALGFWTISLLLEFLS